MKKALISGLLFATLAGALHGQSVSPQSGSSYVAGRFIANSYGQWSSGIYSITSSKMVVKSAYVALPDGRKIVPYATNAPLKVGTETVTPSAVSGCSMNDDRATICTITAIFSQAHTTADVVTSATIGLQEAIDDAGRLGGTVTVDGSWAALGGTSGMIGTAVIPGNVTIEDSRTGVPTGSGTVAGQANQVIPMGTGPTAIGAQSPLSVSGGNVVSTDPVMLPSDPPGGSATALLSSTQHYVDTSQRINVTSLGCVGDGVTLNDTCLQAIANNLTSKHYYFPAGTYAFSTCITIGTDGSGNPQFDWSLEGATWAASILLQTSSDTCGFQWTKESTTLWEVHDLGLYYSTQQPAPANNTADAASTFFLFKPATQTSLGINKFNIYNIVCSKASRCFANFKGGVSNVIWNYKISNVIAANDVTGATINFVKGASNFGNDRCTVDNVFSKQAAKEPVVSITQCTELAFISDESDSGADNLFDFSSSKGIVSNLHIESYTQTKNQTSTGSTTPIIYSTSGLMQFRQVGINATQCPSTFTYADGSVITPACYTAGGAQILEAIQNRGSTAGIDIEGISLSLYTGTLGTGVQYAAGLGAVGTLWGGKVNGWSGFTAALAPGATDNTLVWLDNGLGSSIASTTTSNAFTGFPQKFQVNAVTDPDFVQSIASTASGSTNGLPVGALCTIRYSYTGVGTGVTAQYRETAFCSNKQTGGVINSEFYASDNAVLGSEAFVQQGYFDKAGNFFATVSVSSPQLKSTVATGTAPLVITSTTPVPNLAIGGNAATATALANTPTQCGTGLLSTGITANGTANCSAPTANLWFSNGANNAVTGIATTQNQISYYDFSIPVQVSTNGISFRIFTADNTANLYDVGIYSLSGNTATLVMHTGALAGTTFAPSTGVKSFAITGGPITINPGTYVIAMTTNCATSCAVLGGNNISIAYTRTSPGTGSSSSGVLPGSFTVASPAYTGGGSTTNWWFQLHP